MDDLRERVEQLEEQNKEQAAMIQRLLPSRRQFLTGVGMAGAYALGGQSASAADTTDGRHAAKFGQYAQIEGPNGNTLITLPGGGPPEVTALDITGDIQDTGNAQTVYDQSTQEMVADIDSTVLNTADASAASQGDVLQKGSSGQNLTFGAITGQFSGTTTAITPGFGTWTQESASDPVFLILELRAETDGSSLAEVTVQVDESGGTTVDYEFDVFSLPELGSGGFLTETFQVYLPAGAQYRIDNTSDPNNGNSIEVARKITLS